MAQVCQDEHLLRVKTHSNNDARKILCNTILIQRKIVAPRGTASYSRMHDQRKMPPQNALSVPIGQAALKGNNQAVFCCKNIFAIH